MRGNDLSLYTLAGRAVVMLKPGKRRLHLLDWGRPKEAELVFRKGKPPFNLVLENEIELRTTGPILGLDVGENNLAAINTGKIWGGGELRHKRDKLLALHRRTQSNSSQSAKELLGNVKRGARLVRRP
jgi:transposase